MTTPAPQPVLDLDRECEVGRAALQRKLITQPQLDECIAVARQLTAAGLKKTVNQILVEKNFLSQGQVNSILQSLGRAIGEVDHYEILAKLGEGGMGIVYKVVNKKDGKTYALKTLKGNVVRDKEHQERFQREMKVASALIHPHIVGAVDSGVHKGFPYYVMEFVDGDSLERHLKQKSRLGEQESAYIITQVASALAYANQCHLLHRDIKPANIMITRDGIAKLCDLGIAKSTDSGMTLTQSGFTVGSPHFISPEQVRGDRKVDIRSDLYSLGVTLYAMLTGRFPFDGDTPHTVLLKRLSENPPHPTKYVPDLSPTICSITLKLMARDPSMRYATPEDLIAALEPIASGPAAETALRKLPGRTTQHHRHTQRSVASPNKRKIFMGAGIAVAAVLLLIISPSLFKSRKPSLRTDPPPPPVKRVTEEARRKQQARERYDQGLARYNAGRFGDAVRDLDEASRLDPALIEADQLKGAIRSYQSGLEKFRNAAYAEAIADFDRALRSYPDFTEARRLKGEAEKLEADRKRREEEHAQKKLHAEQLHQSGMAKFKQGEYANAIADWRESIRLDPSFLPRVQPLIDSAQEKLNPASPQESKMQQAERHFSEGEAKHIAKDYAGAIWEYTQAIVLNPDHIKAYHARGLAKADQRDYAGAVEDYGHAIRLDPKFVEAYNNRAYARKELRKPEEALADLNQAIAVDANYAVAYRNRGILKFELNDKRGAVEDWKKAVALDPSFTSELKTMINKWENK